MIVKDLSMAKAVEWGNGVSRRFLVHSDGFGYTLADTIVYKGTSSRLQYMNHLESVYCIDGRGSVVTGDGAHYDIEPGMMYMLDQHDAHSLSAAEDTDLRVVCVFTPALRGDEIHTLSEGGYSGFGPTVEATVEAAAPAPAL
ncbi:MAG: ectoine synthase [Streptosporangiales bacterium]|nr:ectoine synthase [Streptosporangiales bacterium]